uniref:non-specific serine/threonine protein kinase n=1 Tax=Salix viminalis TaxID=40686 RepID=A0A6N2KX99_SALVM
MFSTMERDPNYTLWNTQNVAVHADFNRILVDTIGTAVYQAANMPAGVKKFAATKANYTTQDMLYVLVQCTPDLSSNDCHQCLLAAYSGLEICCNKKRGGRILFPSCIDSPLIRLDIVLKATNQFSNENKLGQGGFGPVYKGVMEDGKEIAVKRLSRTSGQGLREFMNEVNLIARLQHRNLVKLLGCCLEKNEKLLVYEYMPNKSLDVFLYDSTMRVQLDWQTRLSIINGIARGLMYLHVDSRLRIIHRDLKASNILLDYEMNPKISDFGMARIFGGNLSEANTNRIILLIYLAPMTKLNSKDAVRHGEGGFIVSGNCNMRFDLYKYYNASSYLLTYPSHKGSNWKIGMVALAVCAPVVVIVIVIGSCIVCLLKKRGQQRGVERSHQAFLKELACPRGVTMTDEGQLVSSEDLPFMDLTTISAATENFSENNKLGEGGFGAVYKGVLPDGKEIAVKRLSRKSWQGLEEFKNEVKVIAKLQHRNLVRLLGCGIEGEEKLLIYEFMHYKSLDLLIFDAESRRAQLDWETCYSIAGGIARGLLYLHEDSRLRIIHRDLKPSNVLLDHEMVAKISDFGMARIFEENQNKANTRRVAWRLWNEGREVELVDPSLMERGQTEGIVRCIHVGLLCVQKDPADRPTMSFVVLALGSDPITLPQPKEPAFSLCKMFPVHKSSTTDPSVNQMTVSGILPRHALLAMCFLIVLLSTIFATVVADPLYTACSTEYGNYDLGSPFEKNLKVVVETLPSISSSTGFNNTASGIFPDNVSGQALCRGDVTSSACQTCLREASQKLLERMQK